MPACSTAKHRPRAAEAGRPISSAMRDARRGDRTAPSQPVNRRRTRASQRRLHQRTRRDEAQRSRVVARASKQGCSGPANLAAASSDRRQLPPKAEAAAAFQAAFGRDAGTGVVCREVLSQPSSGRRRCGTTPHRSPKAPQCLRRGSCRAGSRSGAVAGKTALPAGVKLIFSAISTADAPSLA